MNLPVNSTMSSLYNKTKQVITNFVNILWEIILSSSMYDRLYNLAAYVVTDLI